MMIFIMEKMVKQGKMRLTAHGTFENHSRRKDKTRGKVEMEPIPCHHMDGQNKFYEAEP